jgi:hypothetical protein
MLRQGLCTTLLIASSLAQAAAGRPDAGQSAPSPLGTAPAAGLYDARLCVTVNTAPAQCGAVTVDVGEAGQALVRISDIAYRLQVYGEQLGVTLFHGTMQIDGFFAQYQWSGSQLLFVDPEKKTRYELKVGTRRFDTP